MNIFSLSEAKIKGTRVKVLYKQGGARFGVVIAENEDCVGVRFDDIDTPAIIPKTRVSVVVA